MPFVQNMKRNLVQRTPGTSVESILDRSILYDEVSVLEASIPYIKRIPGVVEVDVIELSVGADGSFVGKTKHGVKVEPQIAVDKTVPGQPAFAFENI
jgi:hypothetical protein